MTQKTIKTYTVYDKDNNVLWTGHNPNDVVQHFGIASISYIYKSNKNSSYFKPSIRTRKTIRVQITKEVIKDNTGNIPLWASRYAKRDEAKISPEHIRPIPGYPGFYAGDNGIVCYDYNGVYKLVPIHKSKGKTKMYYDTTLYNDKGERVVARLNRVVARAWLDPTLELSYKLDKRVVDHINNDTSNNSISNLQVITQGENLKKRVLEGDEFLAKQRVSCWVYDGNTKRYYKFPSVNDASDWLIKASQSNAKSNPGIYAAMVKNHSVRGKRWSAGYTKKEAKTTYDTYMAKHEPKIMHESCM